MDKQTVINLLGRKIIKIYCRLLYQVDSVYESPLPSGPKIFTINHPTTIDPFIIISILPEPATTLIHQSVFNVPVFGRLLSASGNIPVNPINGLPAFLQAKQVLENGKNIVIFIEGGLSLENVVRPRTGAARLSVLTGYPIVPVGVALNQKNTRISYDAFGLGTGRTVWYTKGPYAVTIGQSVTIHGSVNNHKHIRNESVRIMSLIKRLEDESHKRLLKYRSNFSLILHWFRLAYNYID